MKLYQVLLIVIAFFVCVGFIVDHKKDDPIKEKIYTYRFGLLKFMMFVGVILCISSATVVFSFAYKNDEDLAIVEAYSSNKDVVNYIEPVIVEDKKVKDTKIKIDFKYFTDINEETIGWVEVVNTNIKYPVVQTKDNSYYLNHSYSKQKNYNGWIFADYRNLINGTDKNLIVYGHNRLNGTMFGNLVDFLDNDWVSKKNAHLIRFVTKKYQATYQVFSSYQIEEESYYLTTSFTAPSYQEFIDTILERSLFNYQVNLDQSDKIITLSTCALNNTDRIVVHAKLIDITYN